MLPSAVPTSLEPPCRSCSPIRSPDALCGFVASSIVAQGVDVTPTSCLADLGVDSFSLMEVLLFVETRFGVEVPMADLTPDNTRDVASLATVVMGASQGA